MDHVWGTLLIFTAFGAGSFATLRMLVSIGRCQILTPIGLCLQTLEKDQTYSTTQTIPCMKVAPERAGRQMKKTVS